MSTASTSIETSNPRLLQERIEKSRHEILQLQDQLDKYTDVAATIAELPKKLQHHVMVPIGKRAMMPGKIVRSNEVLVHLGDEYFSWKTASGAVEAIARKKKALTKQIKTELDAVAGLEEKKKEVDTILDIRKLYEDENIKDIQETEEESDQYSGAAPVTDDVVAEYFEIEEDERRANESAQWEWDEVMKRMEELEALEERGGEEEEEAKTHEPTVEEQVADWKAKGNDAFGKRRFTESIELYSKAIRLDPRSHILYGNRSASYFRLKKYTNALEDANKAVDLDGSWVKGHYRKASALAALERFEDAAAAFENAFQLCPTDAKLEEQAQEMRLKATQKQQNKEKAHVPLSSASAMAATPSPSTAMAPGFSHTNTSSAPPRVASNTVANTVFSGNILERATAPAAPLPVVAASAAAAATATGGFSTRRSRFQGNNPDGDVVTLEPVGEAQPVKRVSRFKAQRGGAAH